MATTLTVLLLLLLLPAHAAADEVLVAAEEEFLIAINDSRAQEGLDALMVNQELCGIARAWSAQMDAADTMSHNPATAASTPVSGSGWLKTSATPPGPEAR